MADGDNSTNILLDKIREELSSIVNGGLLETKQKSTNSTDAHCQGDTVTADTSKSRLGKIDLCPNDITTKSPSQVTSNVTLLASKCPTGPVDQSAITLDADLQKMRCDLQQSYELFQTMGEKFDAINFNSLKSRIKDLNITEKNRSAKFEQEVKDMLHESYNKNKLSALTHEMGEKFKKHPGEFGDIPELSEFFQACNQLQNGLEQLRRQRHGVSDLCQRVCSATEISYDRVNEICKAMGRETHK